MTVIDVPLLVVLLFLHTMNKTQITDVQLNSYLEKAFLEFWLITFTFTLPPSVIGLPNALQRHMINTNDYTTCPLIEFRLLAINVN